MCTVGHVDLNWGLPLHPEVLGHLELLLLENHEGSNVVVLERGPRQSQAPETPEQHQQLR